MTSTTIKTTEQVSETSEFFVLGFWSNPYRTGDREYFWLHSYEGRADAKYKADLKQSRGQPSRFTNWSKGTNRFFTDMEKFRKAAVAAGMNPNLAEYE